MVNTLPAALAPILPIVLALVVAAFWWSQLSFPWLFLVYATLALLGVQVVVSFIWNYGPMVFSSSAHFVEKAITPETVQKVLEEQNRIAIVQAVITLLIALPLLWWLKKALSHQ